MLFIHFFGERGKLINYFTEPLWLCLALFVVDEENQAILEHYVADHMETSP